MAFASATKPSLTIPEAVPYLLSGGSWSFIPGQGVTLTYAFMADAGTGLPDGLGGFTQLNAQQISGAELALQAWSDVANVHFTRVGSGDSGDAAYSDQATVRLSGFTTGGAGSAAETFLPTTFASRAAGSLQGDSFYNDTYPYIVHPQLYGYGQQVLVHELGHALGLSHPGNYDVGDTTGPAVITYANSAEFLQDSRQYSVMSYFSETNTGGNYNGLYASAPQILDIAAVQALYGPNMNAFLGDTTYGFNATADRPWFIATNAASPLIFSVWDAGGNDTFDFSGYSQAQKIDLNAGDFSDVGGLTGNVSIALGATIENAVGGSGVDTVIGNGVANFIRGMDGNDSISGGAGADTLNGNKGSDSVDGGDGNDVVFGGQGDDSLQGGAGDDSMNGNLGADTVHGGAGNDTLYGGQGGDVLYGEDGNDMLSGDLGNDTLFGGPGADRFLFAKGGGQDWIGDFNLAEGDKVVLPAGTAYVLTSYLNQAVVDLGGGDQIGLAGVAPAQLTGDWLVFA